MSPSLAEVLMGVTHEDETRGILQGRSHIRVNCPAVVSGVGKRSFKRAKARAALYGKTLYKGRWFSAKAFGVERLHSDAPTSKPYDPNQLRKPGAKNRAPRLKCFCWNAGGLSTGKLDELLAFLHHDKYELATIQETRWKHTSCWVSGDYFCIHSGESVKGVSYCGVLVMISRKLVSPSHIRYSSVLCGRLLHVRLSLPGGSVDILSCYQHCLRNTDACSQHRDQVWEHLERVICRIPRRNLLLVTGDMNSALQPRCPWIGPAVVSPSSFYLRSIDVVGDLCERYDLCVLNSWSRPPMITHCTASGGASCIDMIATRRCHVDPLSRTSCALTKCPLISGSPASMHYPIRGTIPLFWKRSPDVAQVSQRINTSQLIDNATLQTPTWNCFVQRANSAIESSQDAMGLNLSLRVLCEEFFPAKVQRSQPYFQDSTLTGLRNSKWRLWKQLQKNSGASLGAVFRRWWIASRIRALSRISCRQSKKLRRQKLANVYRAARAAQSRQDMHSLFHQVRKLAPKHPRVRLMLRDDDGHLMSSSDEGRRLHEHYQNLFHDKTALPLDIPNCSSSPLDVNSLFRALRSLPLRKAVPRHCVPTCALKYLAANLAPWIHTYLQTIWSDQIPEVPQLWCSAWLALIPKKGKSGKQVSHWRPIGLQDAVGKSTLKAITSLARGQVLPHLICLPQYAYLPGRGTQDAIAQVLFHCHSVRRLLHQATSTIYTRRQGVSRTDCVGGLQILVDLQGAFDRAPRTLLRDALLDLPLPPAILSLLLAWHRLTPYHIEHAGVDYIIEANVGVRQGCVAAPFLWVAFMRFWHKHLIRVFDKEWLLTHLVTYADDNHISWVIKTLQDAHEAMYQARVVLESFGSYGMTLNVEKTVAILSVKGLCARDLRKRYVMNNRSGCVLSLPRSNPVQKDLELPLVRQHVYLGVIVSYGHLVQQTLQHRRRCAQQNFMCLRTWWVPSRLSLSSRINLWKVCVWPSLTYGLAEVGLDPSSCKQFSIHAMKDLRWITHSPCHLTHETHQQLLKRVGLPHPLLMLTQATINHWTRKLVQGSRLMSDDVLHQRWKSLGDNDFPTNLWLGFCVLLHKSSSGDGSDLTLGPLLKNLSDATLEDAKNVYAAILAMFDFQSSPDPIIDEPSFRCELCDQRFGTQRGLKVHLQKIHGQSVEGQTGSREAVKSREHGTDGMPLCQKCGVKYSTWDAFDRHLRRGVCNASQQRLVTSGSTLHQSTPSPRATSGTQQASNQPVSEQELIKDAVWEDWVSALDNWCGLKNLLKHHCVLCHQWFARSWHLTHHGHRQHKTMFQQARLKYHDLLMERGIRRISHNCCYCDSTFQTGAEHKCVVILQIAILLLLPRPPERHGRSNGSRGCQSRRRDESVPRPLAVEQDSRDGTRRGRCRGQQEAQDGTSIGGQEERTRQRQRSSIGWPDGENAHQPSPSQSSSRRLAELSASRHGLHALHVQWREWHPQSADEDGRNMEEAALREATQYHLATALDSVPMLHRRATVASGTSAVRRRIRFKSHPSSQFARRTDRCKAPISLQAMGFYQGGAGADRRSATAHPGGTSHLEVTSAIASPECYPSISCHEAIGREDAIAGDSFPSGSGATQPASPTNVSFVGPSVQLRGHTADRSFSEACIITKEFSGTRSEEDAGCQVDDLPSRISDDSASSAIAKTCWLQLPFQNPNNLCYMNACISALGWTLLQTTSLWDWGWLGRLIISILGKQSTQILENEVAQMLLVAWPSVHRQHDVGEFAGFLLKKTYELGGIEFGAWSERVQIGDAIGDRFTEPLTQPLSLALPQAPSSSPISISSLLRSWSGDHGHNALHHPPPTFLMLQVSRFAVVDHMVEKREDEISFESIQGPLAIPVFQGFGLEREDYLYHAQAVILHHGTTPDAGHYTAYLRHSAGWILKDDDRIAPPTAEIARSELKNCYLLFLSRDTTT